MIGFFYLTKIIREKVTTDLLQGKNKNKTPPKAVLDATFLNSLYYFFFLDMKVVCGTRIPSNHLFSTFVITAFDCCSEIDPQSLKIHHAIDPSLLLFF